MDWGFLNKVLKCQKISNCQRDGQYNIVKQLNYRGDSQKINWHNEVHTYWHKFWCHVWRSSKLVKNNFCEFWHHIWQSPKMLKMTNLMIFICDVKIDINISESHYVNLFFVNIIYSPSVWFFDIWHLFYNLTSFLQIHIFWHLFDNLTSFRWLDVFLTFWHRYITLNHLSLSQGSFCWLIRISLVIKIGCP